MCITRRVLKFSPFNRGSRGDEHSNPLRRSPSAVVRGNPLNRQNIIIAPSLARAGVQRFCASDRGTEGRVRRLQEGCRNINDSTCPIQHVWLPLYLCFNGEPISSLDYPLLASAITRAARFLNFDTFTYHFRELLRIRNWERQRRLLEDRGKMDLSIFHLRWTSLCGYKNVPFCPLCFISNVHGKILR